MILRIWVAACVFWALFTAVCGEEINVQRFDMKTPIAGEVRTHKLLPDEIAGVEADHVALAGPLAHYELLSKERDTVFLFIQGQGSLQAGDESHPIVPETIALPISFDSIMIHVAKGNTLHYVRIQKQLSPGDREDMKEFAPRNNSKIYFTKFVDCQAYTEKIKSPKTVSRTVLPKDYAPRLAMGTVETSGPDKVGAHEHPMLSTLR